MSIEVALEDDLYFADLNRQISLLIDEDDDDDFQVAHFNSFAAHQGYSGTMIHHPPITQSSQYLYQENCRREMCKGTGVFIPQSTQPRRKYKQGKRSTPQFYATKSNNKQLSNSKERTTNADAHSMLYSAYDTGMINKYYQS